MEAAAVLGMGGDTLAGILENAPKDRLPPVLVLSSHTDQELVRGALCRRGYELREETVVLSGGRYYIIHLAAKAAIPVSYDERSLFLGPCLMRQNSPQYREYLERKLAAYRPSRSEEGIRRYGWLREEAARAAADSQSSL